MTNPTTDKTSFTELRLIAKRLGNAISTLLIIAYLTSWGLILAERGRDHLPARPFEAAWQALVRTAEYIFFHPQIYFWKKETYPAFALIAQTLQASAGLLLLALGVALLLGLPLGFAAALAKNKTSSALIMLISVLGTSTPSFLFAMFLWAINIWVHKSFDIQVLPSTGFGWDTHLIMPVLVLAMRPMAQIAQVTHVAVRDIVQKDYIRTAYAKGLPWRIVRSRHMLPNILIPTLTTLGASLRFSLASLPVVELFFSWPGVGQTLLQAVEQGNAPLVTDLILSLGLFFLAVNLGIELLFPLIDARLRAENEEEKQEDRQSFRGWSRGLVDVIASGLGDLRQRFTRRRSKLPALPSSVTLPPMDEDHPVTSQRKWIFRNLLSNPSILIGSFLLIALITLVLVGESLTKASPYQIHGVMMVGGKIGAPPYPPSETFPWGTDQIGRDIQALVLAGGQRTLALAFFSMLARVFVGAVLGALAGWQRGGWLDRLVTGAVGVWAAFPVTLFAMLLIQALGIQQGMWVFVVALSVVGWGEVAQFVRAQVISLKPQLFVESARSIGSRSDQIIGRHILPNLVNSLIVLAVLEMGGSLMLLAELGFLNIFMGGGFKAAIGEVGMMTPVVAHFSDVPEWAALIANVRTYWRSYPWMALYPGLAVFLSIMTFNLFGEGLRRFLDDSHANLSRLFNRYTLLAGVSLVVIISMLLRSSTPLGVYHAEGLKFDEQRVMQDIKALSALEMQGRETGTPGAELASAYIARRMAEVGIFPAGEKNTYIQHLVQPRPHLFETPKLTLLENPPVELVYRKDFVEFVRQNNPAGDVTANVIGAAFGQIADPTLSDSFGLGNSAARGQVMLVRAEDVGKVYDKPLKGLLVIADETFSMQRKDVFPAQPAVPFNVSLNAPVSMLISPEVADRLLKSAGSSLAELDAVRESLKLGEKFLTKPGMRVTLSLQPRNADDFTHETYINVLGDIPGEGHYVGMEDQVIIVSAYYDSVGTDLNGTAYPGANDNASGVAMLLELARLMKASSYKPDKTVLFVAWAGGERAEGLSVVNIMNARPGANEMTVETVVELSGVGYGTGKSIALGEQSSYRLVKLFQEAADRYNLPTTTRGRGPHYGRESRPGFGDRDAMTLSISWDGADDLAHTPQDVFSIIDPHKLYDIGRSTYLTLLVLTRETEY
jgi:peptide/nickel transport system permease protein